MCCSRHFGRQPWCYMIIVLSLGWWVQSIASHGCVIRLDAALTGMDGWSPSPCTVNKIFRNCAKELLTWLPGRFARSRLCFICSCLEETVWRVWKICKTRGISFSKIYTHRVSGQGCSKRIIYYPDIRLSDTRLSEYQYRISSINSDALIIWTRNFFEKIIIFFCF